MSTTYVQKTPRLVLVLSVFVFFSSSCLLSLSTNDLSSLDQYIQDSLRDHNVPGMTITIVQNGNVSFMKAYGVKDKETTELVTTKTLFRLGSTGKAFTAAALGILVGEGKVDWDDKVVKYLPCFELSDPYVTRNVTIRDILCHRIGYKTFDGDLLWFETTYSPEEIIRRFRYMPLKYGFRSQYGYNNIMYAVAGQVIEKVSGTTWENFIRTRILTPLAMNHTLTGIGEKNQETDIATPYWLGKKLKHYNLKNIAPAGSILSNAEDMSNWLIMLLNGGKFNNNQIIPQGSLAEIFKSHTIMPRSGLEIDSKIHFKTYCLGWYSMDYKGYKIVYHGGAIPGFITKVVRIPEINAGFYFSINELNYLPEALFYKIIDFLIGKEEKDWSTLFLSIFQRYEKGRLAAHDAEMEKTRKKGTTPSLPLEKYTGTYEDKMYGKAKIEMKDGRLLLTLLPSPKELTGSLEHWHDDSFVIKFKSIFLPKGLVVFKMDNRKKVLGFVFDIKSNDFNFENYSFKKRVASPTEQSARCMTL